MTRRSPIYKTAKLWLSACPAESRFEVGLDLNIQGFTWVPDNSGLIVSTHGELWFIPRKEGRPASQLTFGELSYESPDMSAEGSLVVSRRGLYAPGEADIVMFSGLKW